MLAPAMRSADHARGARRKTPSLKRLDCAGPKTGGVLAGAAQRAPKGESGRVAGRRGVLARVPVPSPELLLVSGGSERGSDVVRNRLRGSDGAEEGVGS